LLKTTTLPREKKTTDPRKMEKNGRKENRNKYEEYISTNDDAVLAKTFKVPTCRDQCYLALPNIEGF
jgi:hypothetical protein